MISKVISLHPLIFQYLFHRGKWGLYLEELVAASLRSPFHRANTCGNDECFGCIVQLKEASSQNRRTKEAEEMQLPETPLTLKQH